MPPEPAAGAQPHAQARAGFAFSVQYATEAPELPRWRLRRWAQRAVELTLAEEAEWLEAPRFKRAELTLRLVDAEEGRQLNQNYRERDYATNVLTFEYGTDAMGAISGDIVLCVPVLHREAAEQGKPLLNHAAHLTIHGVLHALGYDHLDDAEARDMEALETRILASLQIPDPYESSGPPTTAQPDTI
ncbi:MAG: rRNA maturation RNase YbeY [Alcaligenaceae bacterium]|nr:rRNA maturation RNase YbeY [Alcaligenaceae bacterium]